MRNVPYIGLAFVLGVVIGVASATIPRWFSDQGDRMSAAGLEDGRTSTDHPPVEARLRTERQGHEDSDPVEGPTGMVTPAAPGVVRGIVSSLDGTPVGDVEVTAEIETAAAAPLMTEGLVDRGAFVSAAAADFDARLASRVATRTDARGNFALSLRSGEAHRIRAHLDGHDVATVDGETTAVVRPGDSTHWIARRLVSIDVTLVRRDGEPIDTGRVDFKAPRRALSFGWSPVCRTLSIPEGAWSAMASTPDGLRSRADSVLLRPTPRRPSLEFVLAGRLDLSGHVRFEDERPDGWVEVAIAAISSGEADSPDRLSRSDRRQTIGTANGFAFCFEDVAPGIYLVGAGRFGEIESTTRVEVSDGSAACELRLPALEPDEVATVVAWTPEDVVTTDFKASIGFRSSQTRRVVAAPTAAQPDGTVRVKLPSDVVRWTNGDDEGEAWLEIVSREYGALNAPLPRTPRPNVQIAFSRPSSLTLELSKSFDLPIEDIYFELQQSTGQSGPVRIQDAVPDRLRRVDFGAVTPADYELVAKVRCSRMENAPFAVVDRRPLTVRAASKQVTEYELPQLHALVIECPSRFAGSTAVVVREGTSDRIRISGTIDAAGRFEIPRLPAGHYDIEMHTPEGRMTRSFDVPPAAMVRFP